MHKMGGRLYERLKQRLNHHVANAVEALQATGGGGGGGGGSGSGSSNGGGDGLAALGSTQGLPSEAFLGRVEGCWVDHCRSALTVRTVFLVLDRTIVAPTPGLVPLVELANQLLRNHLLDRPEV